MIRQYCDYITEGLKFKKITKLLHNIKVNLQEIYTFKKKSCFHDNSIHMNFVQNRSINKCAGNILAWK